MAKAAQKFAYLQKKVKSLFKWCSGLEYTKGEWTIIVVGIITIFFLCLNMFTGYSDNIPPPHIDSNVTLDNMAEFQNILAAAINSPVKSGAPIKILTNGEEFLPDLLSEIKAAKHSINITSFIWDKGKFAEAISKALIEKAQQGIEVRLLIDSVGSKPDKEFIKKLKDAGGQVAEFRPIKWWNANRVNRRSHVRDFVIDGHIAYIGGLAVSDSWLGNADAPNLWHDFMFKLQGEMAKSASQVFATMWSQTTGEYVIPVESLTESTTASTSSSYISYFSNPSPDLSSNMEHFIWLSIKAATSSIYIENPYLLPSKVLREALESKARDGVEVVIVAPGKNTDAPYTRWTSQSYYTSLLESGVRIFEYQPSRTHAKIMIIDGKWSIVGSANFDNRSSEINLEYIVGVSDENFARDLKAKFEEDKAKSKEITKDKWSKQTHLMLPVRLLSRLFVHQY